MAQFDARADLIELAVDCPLGIILYVAVIYRLYRYPLNERRMRKWYDDQISPVLLTVFIIGSALCLSWYLHTRSGDPPDTAPSFMWKAMMILCLTASELYTTHEILRFGIPSKYYVGIIVLPALWVGLCIARHRYLEVWAFTGYSSLISAIALFDMAASSEKPETRRGCLALCHRRAFEALLSIELGMISLLAVPLPVHFTLQYSIPFFSMALATGTEIYDSRAKEKESAKLRSDIEIGLHNPNNVGRQVESGSA